MVISVKFKYNVLALVRALKENLHSCIRCLGAGVQGDVKSHLMSLSDFINVHLLEYLFM